MSTIEKNKENYPEFQSLIKLIDDENNFIYENVKERFLFYGENAMPFLKNFFISENRLIARRSKEIYNLINFSLLKKKLREISYEKDILEKAIFLISSYEYPEVDYDNYIMILDKMAIDLREQIKKKYPLFVSPLDKINMLNAYFFYEKGFKGNTKDFYDPDNSYINRIIDRKTGIPISLSIVYILLARRVEIPVYGVNIPSHFIVKYMDGKEEYFIDVFNYGIVISKDEAVSFLKQFGIYEKDFNEMPYLKIAEEKDIIKRVFANLINIYEKEPNDLKVKQLKKLQSYFS